jgi:hypothetical protein
MEEKVIKNKNIFLIPSSFLIKTLLYQLYNKIIERIDMSITFNFHIKNVKYYNFHLGYNGKIYEINSQ